MILDFSFFPVTGFVKERKNLKIILLMKNLIFTSLAALMLVFIIGCRKDEVITDINSNPPTPIIVEFTESGIYGRIIDKNGNPINDAQVTWGTESQASDENGFFSLNSTVKEHNAILKIEKEGYFQAIQTLQTIDDVKVKTTVQLIERVQSGSLQSDAGGTVNTNEEGMINFAPNSFVDASGNAYNGSVNVFAYYLDPTIDDLKEVMPGNLTAVNAENTPQLLTSYGMMNVELEDNAGNPLQLSANATLTTPVPSSLQGQAPESIPLWYFDTTAGTWREEGTATLQGGVYVGEVAHFTWWNCDIPSNFIYLEGQVDGGVEGTPVLTIKLTEISSNTSGEMDTYDKGNFAGPVPINQALLLEVFSSCGDLLHSEEIGPFSEDAELPIIPIDLSSLQTLFFSGNLVNCDGAAVSNGYAMINFTNNNTYAVVVTDASGFINTSFPDCGNSEITYFGVDLDNFIQGDTETTTLTENTYAGNIVTCGNDIVESFELNIDGETLIWLPCLVTVIEDSQGSTLWQFNTTHQQINGQVDYEFTILNWTADINNPEWHFTYSYETIDNPAKIYMFNLNIEPEQIELIANGEVSGSIIHFSLSNITTTEQNSGIVSENCTIDMRSRIQ